MHHELCIPIDKHTSKIVNYVLAGLNQLHHSKSSASNMQAQIQQHQLQQHNRLILQQNILQVATKVFGLIKL